MRVYEHREINANHTFEVWYVSPECIKKVGADKPDYLAWKASGNTPRVIPFTPPAPIPLEQLRGMAFAKSESDVEISISSGFTFTFQGNNYTFDTTPSSREKLTMAYFIASKNPSYSQKMIMKNGAVIIMQSADIISKYEQMITYGVPIYSAHADLFESIKTMTRTQLENYLGA